MTKTAELLSQKFSVLVQVESPLALGRRYKPSRNQSGSNPVLVNLYSFNCRMSSFLTLLIVMIYSNVDEGCPPFRKVMSS